MMKTSFTLNLKFKWHRVIPLLMMAVMTLPTAWADCDPNPDKVTAKINCEGDLSFFIAEDVQLVKLKAYQFDRSPAEETSFISLEQDGNYWTLPHALGVLESGTEFTLEIVCDINDAVAGIKYLKGESLPTWDLTTGTGAGSYTFGAAGAGFEIGNASAASDVPRCGTLQIEVVETISPWCEDTDDGAVVVRIIGDVNAKCTSSTYTITVDGVSMNATINQLVTFNNLAINTYTATLSIGTLECAGPVTITRPNATFTIVGRQGATTSMACADQVNVSLSSSCKLTISAYDVLLGVNDPCNPSAMADSIHLSGPGLPAGGVGSGSPLAGMTASALQSYLAAPGASLASLAPAIDFDDATNLVGQTLKVSVFNRASGNSCWGEITVEDKSAPLISCDRDVPMNILCLEYDGTVEATLAGLATDCSLPITINLNQMDVRERCDEVDDNVLRRVIAQYSATDGSPARNTSATCTDTINVLRFDQDPGDETITPPGTILPACHFVLDRDITDEFEKDPFTCTGDWEFITVDGVNIPAPTAVRADGTGGSGFPSLDWINSRGVPVNTALLPVNYADADRAYQLQVERMRNNCNISVEFSDRVIPFGCKTKVFRTWTLNEWSCENGNQELLSLDLGTQTIIITDFVDPVFVTKVADKEFSVDAHGCSTTRTIEIPEGSDDCDMDLDPAEVAIYDADWMLIGPNINLATNEPNSTFEFPLGLSYVVYRLSDECDNFVLDTAAVNVIDKTLPVMICKEFLAVGLSSDGTVRVPATAFDNGSFDDCGLERTCAVRMDDWDLFQSLDTDKDGFVLAKDFNNAMIACGRDYSEHQFQIDGAGPYYYSENTICTPYVAFCCEDNDPKADGSPADDVMIRFSAIDINGNRNFCMVFVDLQDKQQPEITCLPDLTIDCNFALPDYESSYDDIANDPLSQYFGTIVQQNEQQAFGIPSEFVIEPADRSGLGDGVFFDNCRAPRITVQIEDDIDNCGFGYIKRTIQAVDGDNRSNVCVQIINIRRTILDDRNLFFPNDTTLIGCANPEELVNESFGEPRVEGDKCSLIGISEENQIFTFNTQDQDGDACFKILRTWTIIDWCQSSNNGQPVVLGTDVQIIKVNDPDGPELTCSPTVNVETTDCESENVMLMAQADDECTRGTDLRWSARIEADLNNDGNFTEIFLDDEDITQDDNGKATYEIDAPVGSHRIFWTVEDRCGNLETCQQNFTVKSNKKPTPIAINIATALMNTNGEVEVWASDFDPTSKSYHACYPNATLSYAIARQGEGFDAAKPNITFTCADSVINFLDFYVFLEVDGDILFDFTRVQVRVPDNNGACDNTRGGTAGTEVNAFISGNIRTETAINVPNVIVDLLGGNQGASALEAVQTDNAGMYAFPAMPSGGEYKIAPVSGDDYLNGVSTLDLVMIQRYVLGILDLDSPYKLIASDINNDDVVSALDLVELRKSILGYNEKFANNDSWRYVDATYSFNDETSPWGENFKESYDISELEESMEIDFIGIKIGDVNGSVDAASVIAKSRSIHMLSATDNSFGAAEAVAVDVATEKAIDIVGTQFSVEFDIEKLDFVGVEAAGINISAEHIGMNSISEGIVNISWNDIQAERLNAGDKMFTLLFESKTTGNVSTSVDITSAGAQAEIYNDGLDVFNIGLAYNSQEGSAFRLYQNTPNPFTEETTIEFYLPSSSNATLSVHDVTGKLIHSTSGSFDKGNNFIKVNTSEMTSTGVMYYTIASDTFTDTKRMVVLK